MNIKLKYLLAALPLALATGCSQPDATDVAGSAAAPAQGSSAQATSAQPAGAASNAASDQAPAGSSAQDAARKSGQPLGSARAMQAGAHRTRLAFISEPSAPQAGQSVTWTLKITDAKTGAPVSGFETEMTKKMHLIVVKKDLSWFNHIHPQLKGDGTFVVTTTLPTAGDYKLYADYTPQGQRQEVPQQEVTVGGASTAAAQLVPDKMQGPWLLKTFTSHPEGNPEARGGAAYQVALMPMPMPLKAGQATMLHFQIRDAKGKPLNDLQPYLGALGHCVILSQDTSKYLHSHPMSKGMEGDMSKMGGMDMGKMDMSHQAAPTSGGPDVMFHTNFPQPGLYKAWGQFKHRGQLITSAFVLSVAPGAASAGQQHDDESQPHSH